MKMDWMGFEPMALAMSTSIFYIAVEILLVMTMVETPQAVPS
jgi:hypothetical protein